VASETRVALVTGASSGIGEATARHLHGLGFIVYAAARRVERMRDLAAQGIRVVRADVTDDAGLVQLVDRIIAEEGRIDVLVNNAGYGSYGSLEETPMAEARRQLDVNVIGLARLTQLVLPHMRARRGGRIVNVSSMGGRFGEPMGSWYHATKHAVEGLSDSLRPEVARFGIRVVVMEPGAIRSEWGEISADLVRATSGQGAYADQAAFAAAVLTASARDERPSAAPEVVARAIGRAVTARRPRTRYVVGRAARPLLLARQLLPDRVFDQVLAAGYRLSIRGGGTRRSTG
jgi:NAD(P)-dependent dehydrogenase (short-subunit alcohol dehydrogenase family)